MQDWSVTACPGQYLPEMTFPPFRPPLWLRNAHLQTVIASRKSRRWTFGWENWEPLEIDLGKEGRLVAEASWQPGPRAHAPLLILMHGLEGSARSHYLIGMSKKAFAAGFHTVRVNTRNCGGTEHLTPTLYCAGLSRDVRSIAEQLKLGYGVRGIYAAGVSLGASIILKFLGEEGPRATEYLQGAAVVSVPIDLELSVRKMEEPQNWLYQRYFVRRLIRRMRRKCALFPDIADMERVEKVRSIREFDDVVTAPHFGFGTAENYYRLASSRHLLRDIRVPTLLIQARDDPMIPFEPFQDSSINRNPFLRLLATEKGGHTGFLAARPPGVDPDAYWAESRVVQFLSGLAPLS